MPRPLVGLNLMNTDDFRLAAFPLFEQDLVDIVEFSFDITWKGLPEPEWLTELLNYFSTERKLLGHGVHFSALSAEWQPRQQVWLEQLKAECQRRNYTHVSEHFGFMTAGNFHEGFPLPVPRTEGSLRIGRDRLKMLADAAQRPIGLENLALAMCPDDVRGQGEFIDELLEPIDGFVLLDLHNLYCQLENFKVDAEQLMDSYPLQRVREIHISGGSWAEPMGQPFRRDTHDGAVPERVFELIPLALQKCPNVQAVIFERLSSTMEDDAEKSGFERDFKRLRKSVHEAWSA